MNYYFNKTIHLPFEQAIERVTEELKTEGFGVLTQIDVRDTLKKKLDVDIPDYRILGACNPSFAHRALQSEALIGTMLPCNVIVRQAGDAVEIAAVDPVASMAAVDNPELAAVAGEVRNKLRQVIDRI